MNKYLLLILVITFTSCYTVNNKYTLTPQDNFVQEYYDEFEETKILETGTIQLGKEPDFLSFSTGEPGRIGLKKIIDKNNNEIFYIIVEWWDFSNWLNIPSGESLIFLIDGERVALSGDGSLNKKDATSSATNRTVVTMYQEKAFYRLPNITAKKILKKIAFANEVKVRIIGSRYKYDSFFNQRNFQYFERFYNEYVENINEEKLVVPKK